MTNKKKKKISQKKEKKAIPLKSPSLQRQSEIKVEMTNAHNSYQKGLTKHALYKINNQETGKDLVQTTFLKTLLYLQKGGKINTMRAFLNHILKNLIIDEYRRKKIESLDNLLEKGFDQGVDYTEQIIDIFDGKEIILLTDQLPKKYRTVIQMRYLKGLSIKEIATLTNRKQNTVCVQIHRGLTKLKVLEVDSHKS